MIRWPFMLHILGSLIVCIGLCMLVPLGFSFYYGDGSALPLITSAALTAGVGLCLYLLFRRSQVKGAISHREGMAITTLGWVAASLFGALPFYFSASCPGRWTVSLKPSQASPPQGLRLSGTWKS
jgi:trk system potassium uptake protein TrkH